MLNVKMFVCSMYREYQAAIILQAVLVSLLLLSTMHAESSLVLSIYM